MFGRNQLSHSFKIRQRGVQWKQGVVMYMMLYTTLLYDSTPIHCTPLPLHPPVMNTHSCFGGWAQAWLWRRRQRKEQSFTRCIRLLCVCVCIYIYIYVYTHTCIYTYIYIYIYMCNNNTNNKNSPDKNLQGPSFRPCSKRTSSTPCGGEVRHGVTFCLFTPKMHPPAPGLSQKVPCHTMLSRLLPLVLQPAAVRCDMVLHQALRARRVRKTGIGGEVC